MLNQKREKNPEGSANGPFGAEKILEATRYALGLICKKRYTEHQIRQKLEKFQKKILEDQKFEWKTEELIEKVIRRLKELKYLSDEEFVKDYLNDRFKFKPRGIFLIDRELRKKGIKKEIIRKIIEEEDVDEEEMARALVIKYLKKAGREKNKQKLFQHLTAKGFRPDTIYKVVESFYNYHA